MNLIWICADTFRADHLGCMGNDRVKTPCLDQLAAEGALFESACVEGLPTIPERIVFMTGKHTLPHRGWSKLPDEDVTLGELLQSKGWRTAMMADCFHLFAPGANFHRGFDEWRAIRGQEADKYISADVGEDPFKYLPERTRDVDPSHKQRDGEFWLPLVQYLKNVSGRKDENDYFPAQTVGESMRWLEDNRDAENFMLWIELFDPHEPWDPPKKYYDMYADRNYDGPNIIGPWYHSLIADDFLPEELEDMRALYAGEVTFVDHWIGKLMAKVDELGLKDNTAIVFTSDHGTLIGERGRVTKNPKVQNSLCDHICHVPLIIRHPDGPKGERIDKIVWTPDFMPTCCEMLGVDPPDGVDGHGFWNALQDGSYEGREYAISGWGRYAGPGRSNWSPKMFAYVTDEKWTYIVDFHKETEELYDRTTDPKEQNDLSTDNPDVCAIMKERLEKFWATKGNHS